MIAVVNWARYNISMKNQNQPQTPTWDKHNGSIFESFALDLSSFTHTGKYPSDAGQDVKYGLELQFERLKERNLTMQYDITPRGLLADGKGCRRQWKDDKYITQMEFRTCCLSRTVYRDNRKVYDKDQNSTFYQFITDVRDSDAVVDELYSCPNCGAVSRISVLKSGCPFCKTYFTMHELFPKVTNYYFLQDDSYTDQEFKRVMRKVLFPCIVLSVLVYTTYFYMTYDAGNSNTASRLIYALFSGGIGGTIFGTISGYILWVFAQLGILFVRAGKSMPMLFNMAGSGRRFTSFMSRYSPEFSYEYFSDKVVSLIKMIIYSKNPSDLPYYEGESLGSRFLNVIESSYAGAVALKRYGVQGDYCYVVVDVYLENLYDNDSRIKIKKDKVRVELRKNIRKPIDISFSIEKIQCKSCGASFNAARMRNCPHCGTRYEIGDDDWVITKLR